jgi:hypothetical protein
MKLHRVNDNTVAFHCPGCKCAHQVPVAGDKEPIWTWNNSMEQPTFLPSLLVTSGHFVPRNKPESCWCTYNQEHGDSGFACVRCHSFVTKGVLHYLNDCTHEFVGKAIKIPEWDGAID